MKKFTIVIALFTFMFKANAQIPNSGFEDWDTYPNYLDPVDFLTPNSTASTSFHPVSQSTDHFPLDVGSYSIRFENNTSLLPNIDGFGLVLQNASYVLLNGPGPSFPIVGHPHSLTGYYKYNPQGGDTMYILIVLYSNGVSVAGNMYRSVDSTDWRTFNITIPNYVSADSGSILIAAYNADGYPPQYEPRGNSVLYVDNLNFDNLILSSNSQIVKKDFFNLYPNPASDFISLNIDLPANSEKTLNIYNLIGNLVRTEKLNSNKEKINVSGLTSGIYMIEVKSNNISEKHKLIIQ